VNLLPRLLWSVVLLVPFFGLVVYVFLREEPEGHPPTALEIVDGILAAEGMVAGDSGGNHGGYSGEGH
jgi:hypothetical protein